MQETKYMAVLCPSKLLNTSEWERLQLAYGQFSAIERVTNSLIAYVGVALPSKTTEQLLVTQIVMAALECFEGTEGTLQKRYTAFVDAIIVQLPDVMRYQVASKKDRGIIRGQRPRFAVYWDCVKTGFALWAKEQRVRAPIIQELTVDESWFEQNRPRFGMMLANHVFERSDLSFVGVPHAGMSQPYSKEQHRAAILEGDT
ncbi:hypothetical protein K0504_10045 [Neiella marina]|uniref:Uncharacterized protein n=1 Tax=Neiella holothuriorum TaxID=2870530 RepID=A0ABS7EGB0_9GAMM|nr:hypothetical protein [Neiella holothuriorum]MBW8191379.1 hypothetical protein [Neiella holothuriorum]